MLARKGITFGCLNNFAKINPAVLQLWARVLMAVQDSRILILSKRGAHRDGVLQIFGTAGVERKRVAFVEPADRPSYLEMYRRVDISLDPFPCNGHMTALDSLWMGVPVVSLTGQTAAGRAGLSILSTVGLPSLATSSPNEYVAIAARLAGDVPQLVQLRETLREQMRQSPLMNGRQHARDVESAYRQIWMDHHLGGRSAPVDAAV